MENRSSLMSSPATVFFRALHRRVLLCLIALATPAGLRAAAHLPTEVAQLVISIAPDWESPRGKLVWFERSKDGWRLASAVVPVAYGKNGLAWGRGVLSDEDAEPRKIEGDLRAPAGVFAIGRVFGYAAALPEGADARLPYHQVTAADAWIEDPKLPNYNRHVVVDLKDPPPWYERERMNLDDPAFRWRVEIRHNADRPISGAGSAIFFHIRRGNRLTAGCTTMLEDDLVALIRWLRADAKPHYVLLPRAEYTRLAATWRLPDAEIVSALAF
jgi:L,D-peptidoglycan transpeptidase YkuD (ErfK/YbiS/YcfS/YnhG family)